MEEEGIFLELTVSASAGCTSLWPAGVTTAEAQQTAERGAM